MPVKYTCPKCGRKFSEWGAEKVGFRCPDDEWRPKDHPDDVELVRVGSPEDRASKRPSLKRGARRIPLAVAAGVGEDIDSADFEESEIEAEPEPDVEEALEAEGTEESELELAVVEPDSALVDVADAEDAAEEDLGDELEGEEPEVLDDAVDETGENLGTDWND